MGSSQDPLGSDQGASAESVGLSQVEEETDSPGELALRRRGAVQDESIGAVRVAGDDPAEDGEVIQECRGLPDRSHSLPLDGTDLGEGGAEEGAQENGKHFHGGWFTGGAPSVHGSIHSTD